MKKQQKKRIRKPGMSKWTKEQSDAYSKDIQEANKIDGSFTHTVKSRKQEQKYSLQINAEGGL